MRAIYLVLMVFLIASCARNAVDIKDSGLEIEKPFMRTTQVEIEEPKEKEPSRIEIIRPKDGSSLNGSTVAIQLEAFNFEIVPVGNPVKDG